MNTQPAQPITNNGQQPDPGQAAMSINAAQLAHIAELLDILDGFLRHGDGIADRLADYLHATGRDHPQPPTGPPTTPTCSSTKSASPPTACVPTAENRYSNHRPRVRNFNEHTWGFSMSAISVTRCRRSRCHQYRIAKHTSW